MCCSIRCVPVLRGAALFAHAAFSLGPCDGPPTSCRCFEAPRLRTSAASRTPPRRPTTRGRGPMTHLVPGRRFERTCRSAPRCRRKLATLIVLRWLNATCQAWPHRNINATTAPLIAVVRGTALLMRSVPTRIPTAPASPRTNLSARISELQRGPVAGGGTRRARVPAA